MAMNAQKNKMIIYPLLLLKVMLDDEYPHCTYSPCLISFANLFSILLFTCCFLLIHLIYLVCFFELYRSFAQLLFYYLRIYFLIKSTSKFPMTQLFSWIFKHKNAIILMTQQ